MKRLFIFVGLLLATSQAEAQDWETHYYAQYSQDWKMAIEGPYAGQENDIGATYNAEISLGWEKSKGVHGYRISHRLELHPAINYIKATWISAEYMLKDRLLFFRVPGFNQYIGPEFYTIYRENPNYDYRDPYNYTKWTNTRMSKTIGFNAELQYMVPGTHLGFSANINAFVAEEALQQDGKNWRWDVMMGALIKI